MATVDNLRIEINAQATKANEAIDRLVIKLDRLATSLSRIDGSKITGLANGVQRFGTAMQTMNTIKTSDFTRLATNLTKLGTVNTSALNNAASSMSHLTRAFDSLGTVSANAQAVGDMAKNIAKLGNKSVQTAITNIPQLATAMNNLMTTLSRSPQVSQNIIQMTNALASLANQGTRVGTASNSITAGLNRSSTAATRSSRSFRGLASAIGRFYASYFMVVRGIKSLWSSIESTTDYIEAYNYFNVTFGKIASEWNQDYEEYGYENADAYADSFTERINETLGKLSGVQIDVETGLLSDTGLKNLGLNIQEITQYAAQLASVTNSVGQTGEVSLAAAKSFTMLAGDISSLFNIDYSTAATNLQSGLIGQSRALYKYGIDITTATLQTYAYNLGLSKSVSEMTQAEKMQLRMIAILDQSKVSWGDLANTINSPSNMIRQLTNNLKEAGMVLGQLFIPLLQKVLPVINGVTVAIKRLLTNIAGILGVEIDLDAFGQGYTDLEDDIDDLADSYEDAAAAAEEYKNQLLSFDEVTKLSDTTDTTTATGATADTIDLTDEIIAATSEYEKVWNAAYEQMESRVQEFADKFEKYLKPIENIIGSLFKGDFFGAGVELGDAINSGINSIDWDGVGEWIGNKITGGLQFITGFATTLDWGNAAKSLTSGINNMLKNISGKDFAKAINAIINGIWDFAVTFIKTLDWGELVSTIGELLVNLDWGTILEIAAVVASFKLAKTFCSNFVTEIGKLFNTSSFGTTLGAKLATGISSAITSVGGMKGLFTMDYETIFGAGTAAEIGTSMGVSIAAAIVAAIAGYNIGEKIGEIPAIQSAVSNFWDMFLSYPYDESQKIGELIASWENSIPSSTIDRIKGLNEELEGVLTSLTDINDETDKSIENSEKNYEYIKTLADNYFALYEKQNKSADEMAKMQGYYDLLIEYAPELEEVLSNQSESYDELKDSVYEYIQSLKDQAIQEAYANAIKETASQIAEVQLALSKFSDSDVAVMEQAVDEYEEMRQKLLKANEDYQSVIGTSMEHAAKTYRDAVLADYEEALEKKNTLAGTYIDLKEKLSDLQGDMDYYADAYVNSTIEVIDASIETAENINTAASDMSEDVENSFSDVLSSAQNTVSNITKTFSTSNFTQSGKNVVSGIASGLSGKTSITSQINSIVDSVKTKFTSSNFTASGKNIPTGLATGAGDSTKKQAFTDKINSIAKIVTDKFSWSEFVGLGTNILEGLKSGLSNNSTLNEITEKATSMASSLTKSFKDFLGIKSPSRVFKKLGEYTIEGYNIGLEDMFADSYSLITSWGANLQKYAIAEVPDLTYNAPNISSSYDTNYVSQVDITNQEEIALLRQQNQLLQALLQKENAVISPDADGIFKLVQNKANNYTTQTGNPAFMI